MPPKQPLYYTIKDIAEMLGVSQRSARRYMASKGVRAERALGMGYVYWRIDLLDRCASMMASMGLLEGDE